MTFEDTEPEAPRGWSPWAVALIATLVLLLGLGGALFGINVANRNKAVLPQTVGTKTPTPTPSDTRPSPTPSVSPSASPSTSASSGADAFALPDLEGLSFEEARTKVRDLRLGWRLVFEGTDSNRSVRVTEPSAGTSVKRGDTVKILVRGGAPLATVPAVKGLPCNQAADLIVDAGLYPAYPNGREGVVLSQTPQATDSGTTKWNDTVTISCGLAP